MAKDLYEAKTGTQSLVFAADIGDETPLELKLVESTLYEAGEVRNEIGNDDIPKNGDWLPVRTEDDSTADDPTYVNAVAELIEELQDKSVKPGDTFTITRCEKTETQHYAQYEVNVKA